MKDLKIKEEEKKFIKFSDFFKIKKFTILMHEGGNFTIGVYENFKEVTHSS